MIINEEFEYKSTNYFPSSPQAYPYSHWLPNTLSLYGIEQWELGEWQCCPLVNSSDLPETPGLYLWFDAMETVEWDNPHKLLYIGIAPESLHNRWHPPDENHSGHHIVSRLGNSGVEFCEAVWYETTIVFCKLPTVNLEELERIKSCLIEALAPRLNRQKTPLRSYKLAHKVFKEVAESRWERQYGEFFCEYPRPVQDLYELILNSAYEFEQSQIATAKERLSQLANPNFRYRAVVPGWSFLPNEWHNDMRDCPGTVIRKAIVNQLETLDRKLYDRP